MDGLNEIRMKQSVYKQIQEFLQFKEFEKGGILGEKDGIVCFLCIDNPKNLYTYKYEPNISFLNQQIKTWKEAGITFCGLIHSHPIDCDKLSYADKMYAKNILESNKELENLYFGVTCMVKNYFELIMYVVQHSGIPIKKVKIHLIED